MAVKGAEVKLPRTKEKEMTSLPLSRRSPANDDNNKGGAMPPSQQLAMYKERCERMQAEANDMSEQRLNQNALLLLPSQT